MTVWNPKPVVIRQHGAGLWLLFLSPPGRTSHRLYFPSWEQAMAFGLSRFSERAA